MRPEVSRLRPWLAASALAALVVPPAYAQRADASLACRAMATAHVYDCVLTLSRDGKPLEGAGVVVGADMPSMPLAHSVRAVTATPGGAPGEYRFQLALEMRGEWAVKLRLSGAVRDQLILHYEFDGTRVSPIRR